jgi:CHAT domain-containing protein
MARLRSLRIGLAALLLLVIPGYAAAQVWPHILNGRFADAVEAAEADITSPEDETTKNLAPLCFSLQKIRQYEKLFACVQKLERRIAAGDRWHCPVFCFGNGADMTALPATLKAAAYLELGDYRRSIEEGEAALRRNDKSGGDGLVPPTGYPVEILPVLISASMLMGNKQQAGAYLKALEGHDIPRSSPGAFWWRNLKQVALARGYLALGLHERAFEALTGESLVITRALGSVFIGKDIAAVYEIPKFFMRAKALVAMGKTEDAKTTLDALLADVRIADQGDVHWLALSERGGIAEKEGKTDEAIEFYRRAIEIIERQRASLATEAGKIGFVGDKQATYERLVALLVKQSRPADAFEYVERSKARALVDMLASKKDLASSAADPEAVRKILAKLDAADITARAQHGNSADPSRTGARLLEAVKREVQQTAPDVSSLVTVTSAPLAELRASLGNEVLVEYYYQGKDLYAFLLAADGIRGFHLDANGLAEEVQELRHALHDLRSPAWEVAARALHRRLWEPLSSAIGGRDVIVVPHGALHYLPFAALRSEQGRLLIDDYSLRFLPSASVLKFLRPSAQRAAQLLLAFGNPDLGDPSLDLKFAEEEARAVARLSAESRLLVRKEASKSNFKRAAPVFSRIHFATHGKFQADDPLRSGLFLAKDGDDGVLSVGELYSMRINADLVTLSACETGLGKIANGDDVVGLTRGFLYAGTRSIVASLWSVDDKATAGLMQAFYEALPKMSKQQALRQAQLATRASFPHPFFWAAFQLTGRAD